MSDLVEVAAEDDETFRRRSRELVRDWPAPIRLHADALLRQQYRQRETLPKSLAFIPIFHGKDDPDADAQLETELLALFNTELKDATVIASGENHTTPYNPAADYRARVNTQVAMALAVGHKLPVAEARERARFAAGFERALQALMKSRPGIRIAGVESRSGAILATILEQAPSLVGLSPSEAGEAKWRLGIEARTRQALNRAADFCGAADLFFMAGAFHGPGADYWSKRNNVPFTMWVPDIVGKKLPTWYGPG
jgi:hypothetical protein